MNSHATAMGVAPAPGLGWDEFRASRVTHGRAPRLPVPVTGASWPGTRSGGTPVVVSRGEGCPWNACLGDTKSGASCGRSHTASSESSAEKGMCCAPATPAHVTHMPPSIRSHQLTMSARCLDSPGHKQAQSTSNPAEPGGGKCGHTCRDGCGRSALKDDAVHLIGWVLTRRAHGLSRAQDLWVLGQELLLAGPRDGDRAVVFLLAGRALHGVKLHPRAVALHKRAELRAALLDQVEVDDGGCDLQGRGRGLLGAGAAGDDWIGRRWCECRCRCKPVY